jgi:uncharacterized metal-binding protein
VTTLIFGCSGGSDVGEIADRTARELAKSGGGKMYCLAGVGGKLPSMVKFAREADTILAIDGCPQNCAAHCLKNAGIETFRHLRLAEMGFVKGQTPASNEAVRRATEQAAQLLQPE